MQMSRLINAERESESDSESESKSDTKLMAKLNLVLVLILNKLVCFQSSCFNILNNVS